MSTAKQALLNKWLQGTQDESYGLIPPRPNPNEIKLSFTQQRQLFLELIEPGTAVNNLSIALEIRGALDDKKLEESAGKVFSRHEALRTGFPMLHGLPEPQIQVEADILLERTKYQPNVRQGDYINEVLKEASRWAKRPFDLTRAPLVRLRLIEVDPELNFLIVVVHHSVADGWSLGIFLQELTLYYQDKAPEPLRISYYDVVHWQLQQLREGQADTSLRYWKDRLTGELPVLELPLDYRRGSRQTFNGETHRFPLEPRLTDALEAVSRQEGATLFMSLLAAYFILLYRYTGQEDILVGIPVAGRNKPEFTGLIGAFINTLPIRIGLQGAMSFAALLRLVKETTLEALDHQDLPFEKLVGQLKPVRDLSHSPVFQTGFNMQNSIFPEFGIKGLELKVWETDRYVSEFDMSLMISRSDGQYHGTVEFNSDLFEAASIRRMMDAYVLLLEAAIKNPDDAVLELPILAEKDREELLLRGSHMGCDFPGDRTVIDLFEEQALKTPDKNAITYPEKSLSYSELDEKVTIMAHYLVSKGLGPGSRIGVCIDRSAPLAEVLLGIMKMGGTYIPLSPALPEQRRNYIVQDAGAEAVIINRDAKETFPGSVMVINPENIPQDYKARRLAGSGPDSLAYIIYTSGTTGNPKGVMIRHTALTNFLWSMKKEPGIQADDILLSVTSASFDICGLELYMPLITGGTVVLATQEMIMNPPMLGECMEQHDVTIMQATPAIWQLLLESGWKGRERLKALCGGDVMSEKLSQKLAGRVGELWNMYGPTETTIWSSLRKVEPGQPLSVGRPINNTKMFILDRNLEPVPVGVHGELFIGGKGVAEGYLNNPNLTSEKFIPNTVQQEPEEKLFRTGDRARWLKDYSVDILGRMDDQIKVHGHRIELAEISGALCGHPSVRDAVVNVWEGKEHISMLVAYYVVADGAAHPNPADLKQFLKELLPGYMVPAACVAMDAFPLSTNGKIDRSSLPAPDLRPPDEKKEAPGNETERILADIWQEFLGVERVGIHDNFFDLGGASIQCIQVVARARSRGLNINPEDIFEHQTIAQLGKVADQHTS